MPSDRRSLPLSLFIASPPHDADHTAPTGSQSSPTTQDVRNAERSAGTAIVEHATGRHDARQPQESVYLFTTLDSLLAAVATPMEELWSRSGGGRPGYVG